ncbi:23S rRNA (adenine-N6)-dimethyltransferase [Microbacterium resistens]|uniref:23S rRNA (Adenine-N6)-dimethyltransferase n=1 Tax=Microbacterium resistens TaxID=156977 RepID=A0ABU1SCL5_9MICO|nr:23S rRNA (adenine-N6)-dimethyltransferase [Microbacterium resistens]
MPRSDPRSVHGGRHELGQNFLAHRPTTRTIASLVAATEGTILEIGPGDGALTGELAELGRPLTAVEIDEHRARTLRERFGGRAGVDVRCADALRVPLDAAVLVGNIPFHLTTPLLRRMLSSGAWRHAVLLTQWEVARKRAGVGGSTMLTAQTAPWFTFALHGRVPRERFRPVPSVDGGILGITRRGSPLVPLSERGGYERFVRGAFTGGGRGLRRILENASRRPAGEVRAALSRAGIPVGALPRDLAPEAWAELWRLLGARR